jgi:hypothetical protein
MGNMKEGRASTVFGFVFASYSKASGASADGLPRVKMYNYILDLKLNNDPPLFDNPCNSS